MAGLITASDLRAWFAISPDIADARLSLSFYTASLRLSEWVGTEAYADAQTESPTDEIRREVLRAAEAHLAMHFALLGLNTVLRPGGVVKQEQVEGSVLVQYLSPADLGDLATRYLNQAEELARAYVVVDSAPPAGISK